MKIPEYFGPVHQTVHPIKISVVKIIIMGKAAKK
jgi:hypothetical protein